MGGLVRKRATARSSSPERSKMHSEGSFKPTPPMHWGVMEQISAAEKVGRNDPCPCESGRKFKRCCLSSTPPRT